MAVTCRVSFSQLSNRSFDANMVYHSATSARAYIIANLAALVAVGKRCPWHAGHAGFTARAASDFIPVPANQAATPLTVESAEPYNPIIILSNGPYLNNA